MSASRLKFRTVLLVIAEAALLFGGVVVAAQLRFGWQGMYYEMVERYGFYKAALATLFCMVAFYLYDLYDFSITKDQRELVVSLIQALGIAWIALAVVFYVLPQLMIGRGVSLISMPLTLGLLLVWRMAILFLFGHPSVGVKILIVGTGAQAIEVAREVLARRGAGYRVAGFVDNRPELVGKSILNPRVLGLSSQLGEIVKRENIDRIVVAIGERRGQFPVDQLLDLSLAGSVAIEECASFYERLTGRVSLDMMRPSWLIFSGSKRQTRFSSFLRFLLHRSLALVGGILSLPIALVTAILIKLESPGPALYKQERVGRNGKTFMVLKFRSMRVDAEKDGPVWAQAGDARVTTIGRVIRKIRVDEIPQFWNILKGEMNFIGPRPERPHFVAQLAREVSFYEQRHLTAPGLTGWAQIKYPYGSSVEDARQKLQYDLYYIKNQNLWLDAVIMFETVKTILFGRGAR